MDMTTEEYRELKHRYGETKADKAKVWFNTHPENVKMSVYPVSFCVANEYLWNV